MTKSKTPFGKGIYRKKSLTPKEEGKKSGQKLLKDLAKTMKENK